MNDSTVVLGIFVVWATKTQQHQPETQPKPIFFFGSPLGTWPLVRAKGHNKVPPVKDYEAHHDPLIIPFKKKASYFLGTKMWLEKTAPLGFPMDCC